MEKTNFYAHYLPVHPIDELWGIVCTTVGYQKIDQYRPYPPVSLHPSDYLFSQQIGRKLQEYQIVYILDGEGWYESEHVSRRKIKAGTIILLYPGEWHNYAPDIKTGWTEYWVGFKGRYIDERVQNGLLNREKQIVELGKDVQVLNFYEEIIQAASDEKQAFQYLISGILLHMLGVILFRHNESNFQNKRLISKIEEAKVLMKKYTGQNVSPEKIAEELGVGYTWFRRIFRQYVGFSPAQYQQQLRLIRSKELLTDPSLTISDIAFSLGFANSNQFSTFFRQHENQTPRSFRETILRKKTDVLP